MTNLPPEALEMIRNGKEAFLATVDGNRPHASAAGYVFEAGPEDRFGNFYVLLSGLAQHTKNIRNHPETGILVVEDDRTLPIHERKRLSAEGTAEAVADRGKHEDLKRRFLEKFPRSEPFFSLPDFRFYKIPVREIQWIGGFGKAKTLR